MKKEKKVIKHRILDGNAVLGMILLSILTYVLVAIVIGFIVGGIIGIVTTLAGIPADNSLVMVFYAFSSFIMLAIHKRWFYPEFEGCVNTRNNLVKWLLIGVAVLLIILVPDCIIMLATKGNYAAPTLKSLQTSLVAGITEEIIFRAVPASYGMRQTKEAKKIPIVLVTTSAIFALIHATNILAGASVEATLVQVVTTFGAGAVLCALYLRSGSIIPSMVVHFLYDVYALMNADVVNESGIMESALGTRDIITNAILFVIEIGIVIFLLRRSVLEDVFDLWKKKWNKAESSEEPELEIGNM